MYRAWRTMGFMALWLGVCLRSAFADGMVVSETVYPKVTVPNQQALISFSEGTEHLIIETSFLGKGTNFAWVVPLPSVPQVEAVPVEFFPDLQRVFQPWFISRVNPYYLGVVYLCALAFLAWRSFKGEVPWTYDLPLCLALSGLACVMGKHVLFGAIVLIGALYVRIWTRTATAIAVVVLFGMGTATYLTMVSSMGELGGSLGEDTSSANGAIPGLKILSVQHAGVFETTTIRGDRPGAVPAWLRQNGFRVPEGAEPAIQDYAKRGWVFVASKARRNGDDGQPMALHPLAFTFATKTPVYPLRLTAIENGECAIDLYVFGKRRANARYFHANRCDRFARDWRSGEERNLSGLRMQSMDAGKWLGDATVGTRLSATLSPAQMDSDLEIKWRGFRSVGAIVYSASAALTYAANITIPLAIFGWLGVGASRGGWKVDEETILRWRALLLAAAVLAGTVVFLLLPTVETITM